MKRNDYKVLCLNADFTPLCSVPLSTIPWQEAMRLTYQEKAFPLDFYDDVIHTPTEEFYVPSIIVLASYKKLKKIARYSKSNVKLRDNYKCGYCLKRVSKRALTIDHVKPKSKGGRLTWINSISACKSCNHKKADRILKPKVKPYIPTYHQLAKKQRDTNTKLNPQWAQYV